MYDIEALYEAYSISEAVKLLKEHPNARIIAGGSDILIKIREGKMAGCELVSIQRIDELRGVSLDENKSIRVLPLTSFSHIAKDSIVQEHMRVLAEAADMVGGPQIRNIGTIGGNICNGAVSADTASTLVAYDAIMEITGPDGKREVPVSDFYKGPGRVDLRQGELLSAIIIPKESYENTYGHYIKYSMRNAMDIATLGCCVNVSIRANTIERMRMCFGVAGPVPMRAANAEREAKGKPPSRETIKSACKTAMGDINPRDSWRAGRALRLHIAEEIAKEAFTKAVELSGGDL